MQWIQQYIISKIPLLMGVTQLYSVQFLAYLIILGMLCGSALLVYYAVKLIILKFVRKWFLSSKSIFLHVVAKNKTLNIVSHLASAAVFWSGTKFIHQHNSIEFIIQQIIHYSSLLYVFISVIVLISRLIWSINAFYEKKFDFASQYPIYSYLKLTVLAIWSIGLILITAHFAHMSPWALLTGIGAISAVFLLVFRDTLLGIVASIQVTVSDIVRIGDRISVDKYNVDGEVIDIAINTVKVRNSDNTIATIPTYSLISEVVKNWRGMTDSGGRRIKRALYIDINSISACNTELLERLNNISVVKDYVEKHQGEEIINLALYREYVLDYLKKNPQINPDYLTMVRHLDPGLNGLPIEIYTFTKETNVANYERVQADIFEHCFSALSRFELKIIQYTSNS